MESKNNFEFNKTRFNLTLVSGIAIALSSVYEANQGNLPQIPLVQEALLGGIAGVGILNYFRVRGFQAELKNWRMPINRITNSLEGVAATLISIVLPYASGWSIGTMSQAKGDSVFSFVFAGLGIAASLISYSTIKHFEMERSQEAIRNNNASLMQSGVEMYGHEKISKVIINSGEPLESDKYKT